MHQPNIRSMRSDDAAAVGAVAEAAGLFPADMLAPMSAPYLEGRARDLWLVAEQGGEPVAFAFCEPERAASDTWNMLAIAVRPDGQGGGIGSVLTGEVESRLLAMGGRLLLVETSGLPEFARTRAFYRARGYREEARIADFYADGDDKLVFRKRLRAPG